MSPLKGILVGARRLAPVRASHGAALCAALLLALACAGRAACAEQPRAIREGDVRRAEKVLTKLRLLYDAADADDASAYRSLTSKLFPGLFITVAELQPGDLSTDLSTAVFLAEKLGRTWDAAEAAADCEGERPDIYRPLCRALRGGTTRQLLLAKSCLHARWAEAVVRANGGEADTATLGALAEMGAARANDLLIAARVLEALKNLEDRLPGSAAVANRGERFDALKGGVDKSSVEFADALRDAEDLLAWMPRSQIFYRLSSARLAYADGLSWDRKVRQSKSLVVSANSFAPDPLKELRLDTEQIGAVVQANWKSAAKYTRLAEQSLSKATR